MMRSTVTSLIARLVPKNIVSLSDLVWQYAANFGVAVFGAAFMLALGRLLGASEFGVYAIVAATPAVVNAILDYRLQEVMIVLLHKRGDPETHAQNARLLYVADAIVKSVALAVAIGAGMMVARLYGLSVTYEVPVLAALVIFMAKVTNAPAMGVFRQAGAIRTYALLQSCDWAVRVALVLVAFALGHLDLRFAFLVQLPSACLFNVLTFLMSMRIAEQRLQLPLRTSRGRMLPFLKEHRTLLLSSQAISSVDAVVKELDTLVCGAFLSDQNVAVYKMAKSITAIAWKFVDPIFVVILPGISRLIAESSLDHLSATLKKSTYILFCVALVLFVLSWGGSFFVARWILGPSYADVPVIYPFIAIWIVFALPFIWTHSVAIASGNAPLQAVAGAIGNLLGLFALTLGAASFGVIGASAGLSVAFAAPFVLSFYLLVKKKIVQW